MKCFTVNSEHSYSKDHFESKFQDKISPSEQSIDKPEEELIDLKEEHHDELRKFSSVPIQTEVLTLTSEHISYADQFERKSQANISPSEQSLEITE